MITQRISTLAALLLVSAALPAVLSASVATHRRSAATTIRVTNDGGQTANVMLVNHGWYVLGRVGNGATRVFDVPRDWVGTPYVVAVLAPLHELTGFQSKPINLRPGRHVNLLVTRAALSPLDVA